MKRYAWLLGAMVAFIAIGTLGIWLDTRHPGALIGDAIFGAWCASIIAVGGLIVWRHPRNRVGWLLVVAALTLAVSLASKSYAWTAYFGNVDLPARSLMAWLSHWLSVPAGGCLIVAMILFPQGRLPSPRWRWPMRVLIAAFILATVGPMFKPGAIDGLRSVQNPFATSWGDIVWTASQVSQPIAAAGAAALIVSLVIRSRRATLVERQQIKWISYAVAILPVAFALSNVAQVLDHSEEDWLGFGIIVAGLLAFPAAIGVAILRYRLYDIDLVVNRTIVYLLLTVLLAVVYLGGVTLLQGLIGFGGDSDLAVAASTLAVAGLFQPARRRIQGFIDHYFYRRKYDAQRTVDEFSSKLRDEIHLDAMHDELIDVVHQTMHPSHVSVWVMAAGDDG
jgi:hypothetical protein